MANRIGGSTIGIVICSAAVGTAITSVITWPTEELTRPGAGGLR